MLHVRHRAWRLYLERGTAIYYHTPEHMVPLLRESRAHNNEGAQERDVPANSIDRLVNAVVRGSSAAVVPLLLRSSIARCGTRAAH